MDLNNYEITSDKHQWILIKYYEYYSKKHKRDETGEKYHYFMTLDALLYFILNDKAKECETVQKLFDMLNEIKKDLAVMVEGIKRNSGAVADGNGNGIL